MQIDVDDRAATAVIPDVVGELAQVAANRIRDAHLVPHLIGEGGTLAEVRAQEPAAGQTVDRGTQVSLTVVRITDRSLADRLHNGNFRAKWGAVALRNRAGIGNLTRQGCRRRG